MEEDGDRSTTFKDDIGKTEKGDAMGQNSRSFQTGADGPNSVTFHNITYEVKQHKICKRIDNKIILDDVSGLLPPGLNAIMGPTGSGKTSLLDILADRKGKSMVRGSILIGSKYKPPNFKYLVGYVVQDDVVMGTLSVRENLQFSAALRLPGRMTRQKKKERVDGIIEELGLKECADTKVGTEFFRGVSGGERKRTNIGMELITEPQILFLDEPTTGLDAYTAVSVVQILKSLSERNGRNIIMSIHQPRYSIFKLFDTLTLLSKGNVVYHGNSSKSLEYFENQGFNCEAHENPADFFLDTINECEKEVNGVTETNVTELSKLYKESSEYKSLKSMMSRFLNGEEGMDRSHFHLAQAFCGQKYATSFFWQLLVLIARSSINLIRNPGTSILQLITTLFFAFVIGGIYIQLGTEAPGFQDRIGVFFFITVNQAFGSLSAIELFIRQRALFIHEYASGYYGVLPFFLAKILIDITILRLIPNLFFAVITYFMIGLQLRADKFFIYTLAIMLTNVAAVSVAFAISALTRLAAIANLLIAIVFVVSMLFGGLLISLSSLPGWISWLRYLSFVRYGIEALSINEMSGLRFRCFDMDTMPLNQSLMDLTRINNCTFDGLQRLGQLGYQTNWLWYDFLALAVFILIFLIAAYIILLCIKKEK